MVMAPADASHETSGTPDPVEKGFATLATLRTGTKAFVEKDGEKRKAEILSMQPRKGILQFYVHYEDFNKRLDEWVDATRLDLSQEVEWPAPEKPETKKKSATAPSKAPSKAAQKANNKSQSQSRVDTPREGTSTPDLLTTASTNAAGKPLRPSKASGKENTTTADGGSELTVIAPESISTPLDSTETPDADVEMTEAVASAAAHAKAVGDTEDQGPFSREEEIEKLRTGGSMTQNQTEISRVRNLSLVQMGAFEVEPWYFSPYPQSFTDSDCVHICEFCLSYFASPYPFHRHRAKCTLLHPPGNEIYRDDYVSFFEVDGRRQRTWCRNLCLLSKLFLDHKTLYYDVDPFLFYCMTTRDAHGCHLVGYFSKEKESAEGYNVACILTLPQYQRKGYGKLLIQFSYELSKREGKLGSPEKPLSDLGLLGYRAYWQETIVDLLLDGREHANVEELAASSAMTTNDVLHTLQNLNMLRYNKGQHVIVLTEKVMRDRDRQIEKEKVKGKRSIDPSRLNWKPPSFPPSARTWNW